MLGFEWDIRGIRSFKIDMAKEGVMTCGRVTKGKDIVGIEAEAISWLMVNADHRTRLRPKYLLQEVRCEHENLGVWPKALNGT